MSQMQTIAIRQIYCNNDNTEVFSCHLRNSLKRENIFVLVHAGQGTDGIVTSFIRQKFITQISHTIRITTLVKMKHAF